jgi:hypothetical protein
MFLPFLWVEPVQTELEVTTVVEMVVITFTVPEGELLISVLEVSWKLIEFWLQAAAAAVEMPAVRTVHQIQAMEVQEVQEMVELEVME